MPPRRPPVQPPEEQRADQAAAEPAQPVNTAAESQAAMIVDQAPSSEPEADSFALGKSLCATINETIQIGHLQWPAPSSWSPAVSSCVRQLFILADGLRWEGDEDFLA